MFSNPFLINCSFHKPVLIEHKNSYHYSIVNFIDGYCHGSYGLIYSLTDSLYVSFIDSNAEVAHFRYIVK